MQTFEVEFSSSSGMTICGGGAMRVSAANPADAVEAVKRAYPNARIIAITAVAPKPSTNLAQDSYNPNTAHEGFAFDGMAYTPPDFHSTHSVAS